MFVHMMMGSVEVFLYDNGITQKCSLYDDGINRPSSRSVVYMMMGSLEVMFI